MMSNEETQTVADHNNQPRRYDYRSFRQRNAEYPETKDQI